MIYPVDLHAHTVASTHAYSTVREYFTEAAEKGITLFAITNHGPEMADGRIRGIFPICRFCRA